MSETAGYLTAVQEARFRLLTDDGQGLLLALSGRARLSAQDLCRWHEANIHVTVQYEGEPNTEHGVAYRVVPSPAPAGAGRA